MKMSIMDTQECREALRLIADPLAIQIFLHLNESFTLRFNELKRLCDTNAVMLSKRLADLTAAGLINRTEKVSGKQSVTYSLSDLGQLCLPIAEAIMQVSIELSRRD